MISFEEFKHLELRTGRVEAAERVPNSEKLIRLTVSLGGEARQIVAGIGTRYTPDELVGRTVIIAANLEPRTLMGLESQGMLLAASAPDGTLALLTTDQPVPPGVIVS